jgi:glycosyltransferase involved in cell wall biosynthesis
MEAMAMGVPVVASDVPGNRDLVLPDQTGLLVPVGDRAGYARQMNALLDNAELAGRLGEAGRWRMEQHFTIEKMVSAYVDLYRRVLAE